MDADPHTAATPLDHATIRSIVIGIMLAMFLAALDQTIVATAMPTIGRELRDLEHLPWVASAYLLSATAVTPLYGKLSDIHGRRSILLLGIGIFIVGSIACALASSMLVLILARGLQGLGGGGLISLAQTIIADVVAPRERARYQGWIASVFVTSSVAGPVLGGFFAEHLHWSMIFWINLPLGLFAFWMTRAATGSWVELSTGAEVAFAPREAQGLEAGTPEDLAEIAIDPPGFGLNFPRLDADLYLPALLEGLLGSKAWAASRMGQAGGKARTPPSRRPRAPTAGAAAGLGRWPSSPSAAATVPGPQHGDPLVTLCELEARARSISVLQTSFLAHEMRFR